VVCVTLRQVVDRCGFDRTARARDRSGAARADVNLDGVWQIDPIPLHTFGHASVYDPVRQQLVVIGGVRGLTAGRGCNDVFVLLLTGPSARWHIPAVVGSRPGARTDCARSTIRAGPGDRVRRRAELAAER